jgi:hypothetical protein
MKTIVFMLMVALAFTSTSCNNSATKESADTTSTKTPDQSSTAKPSNIPQGMENIAGEWELVKIIADDNGNHQIDPQEDAKAITTMQDFLKLNADGTCEYTIAKLEGRYEIITTDDGRKKLVMYDKTGTETTRGRYILSVTDKELLINRILTGSDFEVFKRK